VYEIMDGMNDEQYVDGTCYKLVQRQAEHLEEEKKWTQMSNFLVDGHTPVGTKCSNIFVFFIS